MKIILIIVAVVIVVAALVYLYMIASAMRGGQFNVNTNTLSDVRTPSESEGGALEGEAMVADPEAAARSGDEAGVEDSGAEANMEAGGEDTPAATTEEEDVAPASSNSAAIKKAQFAGGCFWCVEADYEKVPGVTDVVSGYAGGTSKNPTYEDYGKGGHREVVEVTYDANTVSYADLVEYLIRHADVTDPDGSFYDRGYKYSPAIFYADEAERETAEKIVADFDARGVYDKPIAAPVEPIATFWPAEEYHQDYYKKNPIRYTYYRNSSGRDAFIKENWSDQPPQIIGSDDLADHIARVDMLQKKWENYEKPDEETLRADLSDMEYKVTQKEGTEPPFQNEYYDNKAEGLYVDIVSGEPLFSSRDKFDSGTGWPSFTKPISPNVVTEHVDRKLILARTEIRSKYADSHLGHVFNDAPKELGGIRYCMNSASLRFVAKEDMEEEGYGEYLFLFP